ncbi:MAG: hypothetical protein P8N94_12800 [Gammaproteobacteria bacterium]|nr:hypothetical protein [Gammaproteobacteria bacterium]MDG2338840.1 hypothetical protein [Gammaproteobacteria bacterium]
MKETQWDDSIDDSKEFFDSAAILPIDDTDDIDDAVVATDSDDETVKAAPSKTQLTDLRRRIEERLESKRIEHEFDYDDDFGYDDLNGLLDSMR